MYSYLQEEMPLLDVKCCPLPVGSMKTPSLWECHASLTELQFGAGLTLWLEVFVSAEDRFAPSDWTLDFLRLMPDRTHRESFH